VPRDGTKGGSGLETAAWGFVMMWLSHLCAESLLLNMPNPKIQLFSADEYARRTASVQASMAAKKLDVLVIHSPENIYYLTGYQTPGYYWHQALILPLEADPVFVPPPHEASLVPEFCWVDDVRLYPDTSDWAVVTADILEELHLDSSQIGLETESRYLSVDLYDRISGALPQAGLQNGSGMIESSRLIKSDREIEYLREAAHFSEYGMQAGVAAVSEGASELDIAAAVHAALDQVGSVYTGLPAFITSGPRTELVHATWTPRVVENGELVFLEIPGCAHRYHAAHTRSVYVGDPPEIVVRASEVATEALAVAKSHMRPGVPARDVFEVGRSVINDADIGYKQGRRIAYGIGIAFPPGWDEGDIFSINIDEERPLEPGMVFHLITTMRLKGVGAIGSSDTVLVTESGVETLTAAIPPGILKTQ
jgi:Xaa-Pro dipeptidase